MSRTAGGDAPVDLLRDECCRAAKRAVETAVRLTDPPVHDGTRMVMVPAVVFDRLEAAVKLLSDYGGVSRVAGDR